jgi:hypothetical protein
MNRRPPPDLEAVTAHDPERPTSEVRPHVSLLAIPRLAVTLEGLRCLPLDARAAHRLSLVDGHCTVETILEVCGRSWNEAKRWSSSRTYSGSEPSSCTTRDKGFW